ASAPKTVLLVPVVLLSSASAPLAVLKPPVVLLESALRPTAELLTPVVRLKSAESPSAVLPFGYPPSGAGGGSSACVAAGTPARTIAVNTEQVNLIVFIVFFNVVFGIARISILLSMREITKRVAPYLPFGD